MHKMWHVAYQASMTSYHCRNTQACETLPKTSCKVTPTHFQIILMSEFFSAVIGWLSSHHLFLFLWQYCSLTLSPTALLRMCTVSHPLPPRAHPALTITTVPHSLSMHKKLNCILPPTPLWCSCQVTMFLIGISQLTM